MVQQQLRLETLCSVNGKIHRQIKLIKDTLLQNRNLQSSKKKLENPSLNSDPYNGTYRRCDVSSRCGINIDTGSDMSGKEGTD